MTRIKLILFHSAPAQEVHSLPHRSRQEEEMLVCMLNSSINIGSMYRVLSTREAHSTLGV